MKASICKGLKCWGFSTLFSSLQDGVSWGPLIDSPGVRQPLRVLYAGNTHCISRVDLTHQPSHLAPDLLTAIVSCIASLCLGSCQTGP